MSVIRTDDLSIAYEKNEVIKNLSLSIPRGQITSIVGPNGCGKSTLLKAIGRILKPKNGMIYLDGKSIHTLSTKDVAKKMAILPQSPVAPAGLTVGEIISYGRFPHQRGIAKLTLEDKKIINWALEATDLIEFETTTVDNLSGGQRQRVWIAMALAQQTDIILLDEPTTYLDLAYQMEVLELLFNLNRGQECTVAMVLHDLNLAARFSDYMIAMRGGRIIQCGAPKEVMTADVLRSTFQIEAEITENSRTGCPLCVSYELIR